MSINTTSDITSAVDVDLQMNLLRNAKPLCPYFTGSAPGSVTQHGETFTAKWLDYANLTPTTTALTELTGPLAFPTRTGSKITRSEITATVSKYGDFQYVTEELDLMAVTAQTMKFSEIFGIQAGRSLNRLQRNEVEDNSTIRYANDVTAADTNVASAILQADIDYVVNQLHRNVGMTFTPETTGSTNIGTAPILASYWGFCHPDVAYDISNLTNFKSVETYAGQVVTAPGEFGYVPSAGVGVRFVMTPEASIDTDSGATTGTSGLRTSGTKNDLYTVPIFGMDFHGSLGFSTDHVKESYVAGDPLPAVMMISHGRGSGGVADPLNEVSSMGWKSWHAAKILKSEWGLAVRCAATDL